MERSPRLRLVLADDHPAFLEGLRRILERDYDVVAAVTDGESVLAEATRLSPDVIVCDISMPRMTGLEVARELRRLSPAIRVVFVTMHTDPGFVSEALRIDVSAYVLKTAEAAELREAVRAAAAGKLYLSSRLRESRGCLYRGRASEKAQPRPRNG
jgi:DNA-binding NarL/FixJ family response regulator